MSKLLNWIACLWKRAFCELDEDIYMPDEAWTHVVGYMKPEENERRAKRKKERKNDKK